MKGILDSTIGAVNTHLNLRLANQGIISSNIANADTPGYKAKAIDFESALREVLNTSDHISLEGSHPDHLVPQDTKPVQPVIYDDPNGIESLDGNTVDRSSEMAKLAENQILYDASIQLLKKKLGLYAYAINEGGGNR